MPKHFRPLALGILAGALGTAVVGASLGQGEANRRVIGITGHDSGQTAVAIAWAYDDRNGRLYPLARGVAGRGNVVSQVGRRDLHDGDPNEDLAVQQATPSEDIGFRTAVAITTTSDGNSLPVHLLGDDRSMGSEDADDEAMAGTFVWSSGRDHSGNLLLLQRDPNFGCTPDGSKRAFKAYESCFGEGKVASVTVYCFEVFASPPYRICN